MHNNKRYTVVRNKKVFNKALITYDKMRLKYILPKRDQAKRYQRLATLTDPKEADQGLWSPGMLSEMQSKGLKTPQNSRLHHLILLYERLRYISEPSYKSRKKLSIRDK